MEVATGKFPYPKWGSVFEQLYQVKIDVFLRKISDQMVFFLRISIAGCSR